MKLIQKPYKWGCLITSFAMALDVSVATLEQMIGHNGSDVLYPEVPDPFGRRGFHVQELIHVAWALGWSVTPYELLPSLQHALPRQRIKIEIDRPGGNWQQFERMLRSTRGVVTGAGRYSGHAIAYDGPTIFDPDGWTYEYSDKNCRERGFHTQCLWMVTKRSVNGL